MGTIFPPVFIGFPHPFIVPQKKVLMILKKTEFLGMSCRAKAQPRQVHRNSREMGYSWYSDGIRSWGDIN